MSLKYRFSKNMKYLPLLLVCCLMCSCRVKNMMTYRNGYILNKDSETVGYYSNGYVLDKNKNVDGYHSNGYILDKERNVIGHYANGYVYFQK